MKVSTFLCKATAVLVPGAASLYIALRANITLMLMASGSRPETTSHVYALRLLDLVSLIVLVMAWLAHTIWLETRVRRAASCERALRVGAQHTGVSLLVLGVLGAVVSLAVPQASGGLLAGAIAISAWAGGIGLMLYGFRRTGTHRDSG